MNILKIRTEPDLDKEDAAALREAIRPLVDGIREEVEALRDEVRTLRNERDPERLLDLDEAAALLGISRRSVDTLVAAGELSSLKIGRRRLVPRRALSAFIRRRAERAER